MSRIHMPHDVDSAEITLGKFMDNAFNCNDEDKFSKAVFLKYGPFFVVKKDSRHRMYFHCTICNKDMNNVRALTEHSFSGNHNKNKDSDLGRKSVIPVKPDKYYPSNTLQYKINMSGTSVPILGLQRVEGYDSGNGRLYYKCILCGAHGKVDSMYRHLIGNKHTDKYIKCRIVLRSSMVSGDERMQLRERIFAKESYTVDDIRTIKGRDYYPYKWEDDAWVSKIKNEPDIKYSPDEHKHKNTRLSKDLSCESDDSDSSREEIRSCREEKVNCVKIDKSVQAYSYGFLNNILLKFNLIIQAHLIKDTDLHSCEDLKVALSIMRYALHLLYYMFDEDMNIVNEEQKQQKLVVKTCLGYIMKRLIPHFETLYGKL